MSSPKSRPGPVKLVDIAAATGLSLSTVSRVLNRRKLHERLSRETTERVHAAARRLGYLPHHGAQALATNRSRVIGVAVYQPPTGSKSEASPLGSDYLGTLLGGADLFLRAQGYDLLLLSAVEGIALSERCLAKFRGRQIDGVLMTGDTPAAALRSLVREGVPVVAADYAGPANAGSHIGLDNPGAMAAVLDHLQSLGHRRIAFLGRQGLAYADIAVRRRAFQREMARRGLSSPTGAPVDWPPPGVEGDREAGLWTAERIAALGPRRGPTAVVTVHDRQAFALVQRLRELELSCPRDVSVVGFDDSWLARLSSPTLTTVDHVLPLIAERAAAVLLEAIERSLAGRPFVPVREKIMGRLMVRESTAAVPGR